MILELFLTLLIGTILGLLTGLIPGIHTNLISAILLSLVSAPIFISLNLSPTIWIVFLIALSTAHGFVTFIPSIFLGAPNEQETCLSILPGHEMLIKGKAYEAVFLALLGSLLGLLVLLFFTPLFYFFLSNIYDYVKRIMPLILIVTSFFLIYFEKSSKTWAIIIFVLSGFLGLATLNLPIKEPLLPLFTGLFGISSLITSITSKIKIPKQQIPKLKTILPKKSSILKSISASFLASPLCSFLPGLGSGQAAVIGSEITGELNKKEFLVLLGSINTIVTGLSFITLYSIGKARTGIAASIDKLTQLSPKLIILITLVIILASIFSFFASLIIAKYFSKIINKINYSILSTAVILFLILVVFLFSGFMGLLLALVSTFLGLTCIYSGIRRTHLMGCLIITAFALNL